MVPSAPVAAESLGGLWRIGSEARRLGLSFTVFPGPSGARRPTFDEELLLWLGDEPPGVRTADAERPRDIGAEFARGFDSLARVHRAVSIFGSARTRPEHPAYTLVREVAAGLGRAGYAIITGGGRGLMEAANRGARDAGTLSIGCNIELPREQKLNPYVDVGLNSAISLPARSCSCVTRARL